MSTKKVIAYIRVSTTKQLDGQGPAQQRANICAYAAVHGLQIDEWRTDDETGTSEEREHIQSIIAEAKAGTVGMVIFDRMDRLGRRLLVCESLYQQLIATGVQVTCVQHMIDNSPIGALVRQVMGAIAEYQRSEWLTRMATCRRQSTANKGTYAGGRTAYGYRAMGDGKLEPETKEAGMVKRVFELRSQGYNLSETAAKLAEEGYTTRKGTPIQPVQVSRICERQAFYAATAVAHDVELAPGVQPQHPPLIMEPDNRNVRPMEENSI